MRCSSDTIRERARLARQALSDCRLCARDCRINRLDGQRGYCGLGPEARCFRELLHPAEEQRLNPSHQLYFSGCSLRCEFCSVLEWVKQPCAAEPMDMTALLQAIEQRRSQGARTLNILGGEPTVNLPGILDLLARVPSDITVVWNSNMYFGDTVLNLLDGVVDIYLADFKCGNATCARRILDARDYVDVVQACLLRAAAQTDLIIRHVVMPGHWDCCTVPILHWIAEHLPTVEVSLRFDYAPPAAARHAPGDYVNPADRDQTLKLAEELALNLII